MSKTTKERKLSKASRVRFQAAVLIIDCVILLSVYFTLPYLLNTPTWTMDPMFQLDVLGFNFIELFLVLFIVVASFELIVLKVLYKNLDGYINRYLAGKLVRTEENEKKFDAYILKIRDDCIDVPYKFFIVEGLITFLILLIIGSAAMFIGGVFDDIDGYTIINTLSMILGVWFIINVSVMIAMQVYNLRILKSTYRPDEEEFPRIGKKVSGSTQILMQLLPVVFSLLVLFATLSYVRANQVKASSLYNYYKQAVSTIDFKTGGVDKDKLLAKLNVVPIIQNGDSAFVIAPDNESYTTTYGQKISDYVLKYRDYFFGSVNSNVVDMTEQDDELFEEYGVDYRLYCKKIYDEYDRAWYIGFIYNIADIESAKYYLSAVSIIMVVYSVLAYAWSKSMSTNERMIADNMEEILVKDDFSKGRYIPILSSDETGDIAYYYNKIQYRMVRQQDIMVKQEQLSVLGEMAGGMAHDINTPISAINTAINMLSKKHSDDERDIQILENMQVSTDRIISIVTSMRNQVRNMGSNQKEAFPLNIMLNDIGVITANEQKKSGCTIDFDIKEDIMIYGERTKLGQVLTNLAVNGLQAYVGNGKKGTVTIHAKKIPNDRCLIEVEDHAGGIPEKVQPYIFNNIMTTKGAKGTGLGLYLASTVIKGVYEGTIDFKTVVGDGTTFIIDIPLNSGMINSSTPNTTSPQ